MKIFKVSEIKKILTAFGDRGYVFQELFKDDPKKEENIFISKLEKIEDRDAHNGEHATAHLYNPDSHIQLNVRFNDDSFVNGTKEHFMLSGRIECRDYSMGGGTYNNLESMLKFIDKLEAKRTEFLKEPLDSSLAR